MLSETKKIASVVSMTLVALIIEVVTLFGYMMSLSQKTVPISNLIYNTGITRWGWLPTIFLGVASIVLTIRWQFGSTILRVIIIFISVITIILAALWLFGIYFITHLNP